MTDDRYCAQCNRYQPAREFLGKKKLYVMMCSGCRSRRTGGKYRPVESRRHLRVLAPEPRVLWAAKSGNAKLGRIGSAIVSAETCPPTCGFYKKGCYAELGHTAYHWRRAQEEGLTWSEFLDAVRAQQDGALWRYAVAGDLPGIGKKLDTERLRQLAFANRGKRGFAFTHKPLELPHERAAVFASNQLGFTINRSADNLEQADQFYDDAIAPVAVVLPADAVAPLRTPKGRPVAICPAQTHDLTCEHCGICQRSSREGIVGFLAHGQKQKLVTSLVRRTG